MRRMRQIWRYMLLSRSRKEKTNGGDFERRETKVSLELPQLLGTPAHTKLPVRYQNREAPLLASRPGASGSMPPEISDRVSDMTARLSHLERHYSRLRTAVSASRDPQVQVQIPPENQANAFGRPSTSESLVVESQQTADASEVVVSLGLLPIAPLGNIGTASETIDQPSDSGCDIPGLQERSIKDTEILKAERTVRSNNGAAFRPAFDIFFHYLNPLHPLLNENQFRAQFDQFVFHEGPETYAPDRQQFLALTYLVSAEIKLLHGGCADPNIVLGWQDFCTAETILAEAIWGGKASLLTLQSLLIKTRYLLYVEKFSQAYDTMATAVRTCLQIGLHNQSIWKSQGLSGFEVAMRQRVFWSMFTLERAVALNCGLPYILRATDFNVDLPRPLDDRSLFPNRSLPHETPECSFIPYMLGVIKWAALCGEIWDAVFSVSAQKPAPEQLVASLDAKILLLKDQLPAHLQWRPGEQHLTGYERTEAYVQRQKVLYHLVC